MVARHRRDRLAVDATMTAGEPVFDPATLSAERAAGDHVAASRAARAPRMAAEVWEEIAGDEAMVLTPDGAKDAPPYVYLHGGGWVLGSPTHVLGQTRRIADQAKRVVIAPRYPLSPEMPYPGAIARVSELLAALATQDRLGGVIGSSAGAQVGLGAMLMARDRGEAQPRAAVWFNGAFAQDATAAAHAVYGTQTEGLTTAQMRSFYAAYGVGAAADPRYGDLTRAALTGLPPMWFMCGDLDPLVEDTLDTYRAALSAGIEARLQILPFRRHGFAADWHDDPDTDRAITLAIDWLGAQ